MKRCLLFSLAVSLVVAGCRKPPTPEIAADIGVKRPAAYSTAITAKRPKGGEYFGLYLLDNKIGYLFTDLTLVPGRPDRAQAVSQTVLKTNLGGRISERRHSETRVYEAQPGGKLLSFVIEMSGDGGNQTLEGSVTPSGTKVVRRRPQVAEENLSLPVPKETLEDADQVRVALAKNAAVSGFTLHSMDLETYALNTTLNGEETRTLGGVTTAFKKVVSISEKEKVPTEALVDGEGRILEIRFGPTMRALAQPEAEAKSLEHVEVFGLTRVTLPRPLPESVKDIPGAVTMVMKGLPSKFQVESRRQTFRALNDEAVEVTLRGVPPVYKKRVTYPLSCPNGGEYLKNSIIVEANNADIKAQAQKIVGDEKDALLATRLINAWVYQNMKKDYGASADRATDVLRQMRGDCTEHSLLMVAMLRSLGIPSRRIDGLIYMVNSDGVPAFYWHEWVEAYVGEWTQLDPTFGQDVADARHFALGEETAAEITPLLGSLNVTEVR